MSAASKLQLGPRSFDLRPTRRPGCSRSMPGGLPAICFLRPTALRGLRCRSFRPEGGEADEGGESDARLKKRSQVLYAVKSLIRKLSGRPAAPTVECRRAVARAEELFFSFATQFGRYLLTMMSTGVILAMGFQLSGGDSQMNAVVWYSWLGGIIIGTMVGANLVLEEHCKAGPRNVVITGSTRGLGKALAREFLLTGDRVVIASRRWYLPVYVFVRYNSFGQFYHLCALCLLLCSILMSECVNFQGSPESVDATVNELQQTLEEGLATADSANRRLMTRAKVVGVACDVCKPDDVERLSEFAASELGSIDIWINNAGTNKGFRPLLQFTDEDINQIVSTNLMGSLICTREAMHVMMSQKKGGHIFNMDGAGSGGSSTPLTAVYGSTKCGLRQLQASLLKECKRSKVGVHTASPGMVLTDLLLSGSTLRNKQMFNIICELPETVARTLVPRMRIVKGNGRAINYLTPPRILLALVTAWLRQGRWFDDQGRALYAAEADRIRNWAESRTRFSFTDAMEMYTENTWVSVFSLSVVCAFIILSSST